MDSGDERQPLLSQPSTSRRQDGVSQNGVQLDDFARDPQVQGPGVSFTGGSVDRTNVIGNQAIGRKIDMAGGTYNEGDTHHHHPAPQPTSPETPSADLIDLTYLKEKLRSRYSRMWLQPLAYLDDLPLSNFYVDLKYEFWDLTGRVPVKKNLDMRDVLQEVTSCHRFFLVMGDPGCGKTILLTKMANDWATGQEYLAGFDLVILYTLRDLPKDKSLEDALKDELLALHEGPLDPSGQQQLLQEFREKKMLLLLDGHDELDNEGEKSAREILHDNHMFYRSTFVVTSRYDEKPEFLKKFEKRVRISELDASTKNEIIDKYFSHCGSLGNSALNKELVAKHKDIIYLRSPLLLLVFCFVFDKSCSELEQNSSNIIPEMVRNLMLEELKKNYYEISKTEIDDILNSLGEFFLKKLSEKSYVFSTQELETWFEARTKLIMSIRLFQQRREQSLYEALHKNVMDSLSCNYLNFKMKKLDLTAKREEIRAVLGRPENISTEIFQLQELHLVFTGSTREVKYLIPSGSSIFCGHFETEECCRLYFLKSRYNYWSYNRIVQKFYRFDEEFEFHPAVCGVAYCLLYMPGFISPFMCLFSLLFSGPVTIVANFHPRSRLGAKKLKGNFRCSYKRFKLSMKFHEDSERVFLRFESISSANEVAFPNGVNAHSVDDLLEAMFFRPPGRHDSSSATNSSIWELQIGFERFELVYNRCRHWIEKK